MNEDDPCVFVIDFPSSICYTTFVEGVVGAAYARYANMLANAWYTLIDETHTVGRPYVSQVSICLHERIRVVSAHFYMDVRMESWVCWNCFCWRWD